MENGKHVHQFMPLVSRLDHLELIMKNLESKRNVGKCGSNSSTFQAVDKQSLPLNLAVRDAYFKGSLLARVASLENRLFQLSLDLESIRTPSGTSVDASSSQGSKKEVCCSLPTFSNNNPCQVQKQVEQQPQVQVNRSEIQGKYRKLVQQRRKKASPIKELQGKSKGNRDEKTCKTGKKRVSSNWPHLKILGC